MRSAQLIVAGESQALFDETERGILEELNPTDSVSKMLADRVVVRNWYRLRGERALRGRTAELIEEIVNGAGERAAGEVRRLAPLVDSDAEAVHQLRLFPEGVAYLREQYAILLDRLATGQSLLYSDRQRCFTLAAKRPEDVLRGDRVATKLLRAQIGVMLGQEGTLDEVASYLGGHPPEGMPCDEFSIRVKEMTDSVRPRNISLRLLKAYLSKASSDLAVLQSALEDVAQRQLQNRAEGALLDSSPEGAKLVNLILAVDRGCDAALKRLEIRRKPERPGPKRGPKKAEAPAAASPPAEPPPAAADAMPDPIPAALATIDAAEVPTEDPTPAVVTATEAAEPNREDDPGRSLAEPGADRPIVEPVSEETVDEAELEKEAPEFARMRKVHRLIELTYGTLKPIAAAVAAVPADEPAPVRTIEAAEPKCEVDPGPATVEPDDGFSTDEPTGDGPPEPSPGFSTDEPTGDGPPEPSPGFSTDEPTGDGPREPSPGFSTDEPTEDGPREPSPGFSTDEPTGDGPREPSPGFSTDEPTGDGPREPSPGFSTDEPTGDGPREPRPGFSTDEPTGDGPRDPSPGFSTDEPTGDGPREPSPGFSTDEPTGDGPRDPSPGFSTDEPTGDATPAGTTQGFSTVEPTGLNPVVVDDLERFGPEAETLRKFRLFLELPPGARPDLAPRDNARSPAVEQWRLRNEELARQFDAHLAIDTERPDPAGPAAVADEAADHTQAGGGTPAGRRVCEAHLSSGIGP